MPLWQGVYVGMIEAVYHNWDGRARREPNATIPTPWAQALATLSIETAAWLARQNEAQSAQGTYLLEVGDGVGPVTVSASEGTVRTGGGRQGTPDVTLHLTADQYVRLLAGRLPLRPAIESGEVTVEGDRGRAEGLNRIFAGIAN
jgi:putative sterol carrier protein